MLKGPTRPRDTASSLPSQELTCDLHTRWLMFSFFCEKKRKKRFNTKHRKPRGEQSATGPLQLQARFHQYTTSDPDLSVLSFKHDP